MIAGFSENGPYRKVQAFSCSDSTLENALHGPTDAAVRLLLVACISGVGDQREKSVRTAIHVNQYSP
jgi:hypothetical protein